MKTIDFNERIAQKKKDENYKDWYDNGIDAMSRIGRDDADKIVKFVLGYLLMEAPGNDKIRSQEPIWNNVES